VHLHLAIVPPAPVLAAVADVVDRADPPVAAPVPEPVETKKRLFGRRREDASTLDQAAPPGLIPPQLEHVDRSRMMLPVASFGSVTTGDAGRLTQALRDAASTLAPPTVHLAGSAALEFPGDVSVWAKLAGDVDDLSEVARGMTRIVERVGFFVDRRQFRPMLQVATITDATTVEVLQRMVDDLDAFQSEQWTVGHVSLMTWVHGERPPKATEVDQIPLGSG
jgi:2'-5' RNA ligase